MVFGGEYEDQQDHRVYTYNDLYKFNCEKHRWTRIVAPNGCKSVNLMAGSIYVLFVVHLLDRHIRRCIGRAVSMFLVESLRHRDRIDSSILKISGDSISRAMSGRNMMSGKVRRHAPDIELSFTKTE